MVIYLNLPLSLDEFFNEIRGVCNFNSRQIFTTKWLDEEGNYFCGT